ncbi:MAG: hypothetical protein QOH35_4156 [Acidobacteriaceae bacterium]|jgi:hypothetical protein|nr:hypothetical protein [Acidobacteriaceae bacterium]
MKESEGEKTVGPSTPLPRQAGTGRYVGVRDFFKFRCSLRPESSQEHLQTSIAGVLRLCSGQALRLRAIKPSVCDRSANRYAQDDKGKVVLER